MKRMLWCAVAVWFGCESAPKSVQDPANGARQPPLEESTRSHYDAATELQRAITHGRLADARSLAAWIERYANPRSEKLATAASQISHAPDIKTAAALTGVLAGACVSCHTDRGVRTVLPTPVEPVAAPGIAAQMLRHEWAATRLWAGVVGPDDDAWLDGARAMSNLTIDLATNTPPNVEIVEDAVLMSSLASRAITTTDHRDRATVYGFMLHTCANCHAIVRPRADAARR